MNRFLALCMWIVYAAGLHAQSIPAEWKRFTGEDYVYDIQRDHNAKGVTESQFKKRLQEASLASLARKVKVQVNDFSRMDKSAVNGRSNIGYQSSTEFSSDVNLTLADSKFRYDAASKDGAIIVYINKPAACMFYKNEIRQVLGHADNIIETAQSYIEKGFKGQARKELASILLEFHKTGEPFFWLNFFGVASEELSDLQNECNRKELTVNRMLADLKHGTTVYLSCNADLSGKNHKGLENELKGAISTEDCSIVDTPEKADWIIKINATTREYNKSTIGSVTSYFTYADAHLSIDKHKTSQRIYENSLSVKGGHTLNFTEAGRDAYKSLTKKISSIIKESIKE